MRLYSLMEVAAAWFRIWALYLRLFVSKILTHICYMLLDI